MIREIQKIVGVKDDGVLGNITLNAIIDKLKIPNDGQIPSKRIQSFLKLKNDGKIGPITLDAIATALGVKSNIWPRENYKELNTFYGLPGTNQVRVSLPYKMRLSWELDTTISSFMCNLRVTNSLQTIFENTLNHYGKDGVRDLRLDVFGGCLNVRPKRGGSSPSAHSWGIAVDLDPDNNQLKWGKDRAKFAKPEYNKFWEFVADEGWTSLGHVKNYDWMHFQAASR